MIIKIMFEDNKVYVINRKIQLRKITIFRGG